MNRFDELRDRLKKKDDAAKYVYDNTTSQVSRFNNFQGGICDPFPLIQIWTMGPLLLTIALFILVWRRCSAWPRSPSCPKLI